MNQRTVFVFLIGFALSGCAGSGRYAIQDQSVLHHIGRDPYQFTGQVFAFEGKVLQSSEVRDGTYFQVLVKDVEGTDGNLMTVYFPKTRMETGIGNEISVLGSVEGGLQSKNIFGGTIRSVAILGIGLRDKTLGGVQWSGESEAIFKKWQAGTLFVAR